MFVLALLPLLSGCAPESAGARAAYDQDEDGYSSDEDCDDHDADVNASASERCNGTDDDCDGTVDEEATDALPFYADADGDTYGDAEAIVQACSAPEGTTADATDCDDALPGTHPGALETCNDHDEDCDGLLDNDAVDAGRYHRDADSDGYGDALVPVTACSLPDGHVADASDCDDTDALRHPGATEVCDGARDEDCDGAVDDADADVTGTLVWYQDGDADGYGNGDAPRSACLAPSGYVSDSSDCDDHRPDRNPGLSELCDAADTDEDCDGLADDADPDVDPTGFLTYARDADGDGSGGSTDLVERCDPPVGYVPNTADCDDGNADRHPGAVEVCDGVTDEDCDGLVDDADIDVIDPSAWFHDGDGDGWGEGGTPVLGCLAPDGYVAQSGDCDDEAEGRNPGAIEVCDAARTDEDCDTVADDDDSSVTGVTTWYLDADGDGWGDEGVVTTSCLGPGGYVDQGGDCDAAAGGTHPGAAEICDGAFTDEDCDSLVDDDDPDVSDASTWFLDLDGDGYAGPDTWISCLAPSDGLALSEDCADGDAEINPGVPEVCDEVDQDCDGEVDEGVTPPWYADVDGDGWGDPGDVMAGCEAPEGFVADGSDCDDADAAVFPDETGACGADTGLTGPIRFLALGDTGDGSAGQYAVGVGMAAVCASVGCDFVLFLGDNFYPGGVTSTTDPLWTSAFELPYAELNLQFWAVMGNHDWNHGTDPLYLQPQIDYTAVSPKWYMPADYYSRVAGDATFFGIDTQLIDLGQGADQEVWLPAERAASTTPWNILYGHHPYRSNGPHNNAGPEVEAFMNDHVCGQFDLYLSGHDHNLQWLEDTCGTAFIVSGGGHSVYGLGGGNPTYFEAASTGFLWVEIDGLNLTGVFYDASGTELFRRTISR